MQQQISIVTLGISDIERSKRFYREGFGWEPVFQSEEIVFYQMNGFVLGTWLTTALEQDVCLSGLATPGAASLAHNVASADQVNETVNKLVHAGARLLREPDAPPQGGRRGYVSDRDGHIWEIAWNPAWPIDEDGHVTFGV